MLQSIQLPYICPVGAGREVVDDDDPLLVRCPLVIEGSPDFIETCYGKFWDYRLWHKLVDNGLSPEVMAADDGGRIAAAVQELYGYNDVDLDFSEGVDSVTLLYPKAIEARVTKQLSEFPPLISLVAGSSSTGGSINIQGRLGSKSVHVQGRSGVKSLAVLEQRLDIEVPDTGIFLCLNNPSNPSWVVVAPRNKPSMRVFARQQVLNQHAVSEEAAWNRVDAWLRFRGIPARAGQYPEGENCFPDFRAWIGDEEYDVEMTSVPDMGKWTIKSTYRDLEKRVSEVARQPGETQEEVTDALSRILSKKGARVAEIADVRPRRRSMLVVSNWSAHQLYDRVSWSEEDISPFDVVMLLEFDEVRCIRWKGGIPG